MTTLILAGEAVVAAAASVTETADGYEAGGVLYPHASGVTGVVEVAELPADWEPGRYLWRSGALVASPAWSVERARATAGVRAARIADVKAEAGRRILAVAPEWQQRNLNARASELALTYPGLRGEELPEPERSEWTVGQAVWSRIKAIREASNTIEAALVAATDPESVDVTVGWP